MKSDAPPPEPRPDKPWRIELPSHRLTPEDWCQCCRDLQAYMDQTADDCARVKIIVEYENGFRVTFEHDETLRRENPF